MNPRIVSTLVAAAVGLSALTAEAEQVIEPAPIRLHGVAAAAHAFGGHQQDEFSIGAGLFGVAELGVVPELGIGLAVGDVWLSEGADPDDPDIAPAGAGSAFTTALSVTLYPLASTMDESAASAAGLWVGAAGGATRTGGAIRGVVHGFLGWDWLYPQHGFSVGPVAGLLHIFQPNDELRPADANVGLLGVHLRYGIEVREVEPPDGDLDGDGIRDSVDKCPKDAEDRDAFEDEDGCPEPDNDGDGIPDSRDDCPDDAEDRDGFQDKDGCPELDNDNDKIPDAQDKCPNDPEDADDFEDEDGCPEPDNDQDGILDPEDLCPNEPETKNGYADHDGCPDEEQVRVIGDKIVLDDRVHFRTNNAVIRPQSYPLLERLAKLVREHPEYVHINVEGHADQRGSAAFNLKLSASRARSVLEFMVKHGVERERLSSEGFGATRPLIKERSTRAYFMNRRVEFTVTRETKAIPPEGSAAPPPESGDSGAAPGPGADAGTAESGAGNADATKSAGTDTAEGAAQDAAGTTGQGEVKP